MNTAPLPIDGKPMRMSLGLRTLDLSDWLDVDPHYAADLTEKSRLLREHHGDVVAHVPSGAAGARETLDLVTEWMHVNHPGLANDPPAGLHPVDAAGRLVQEDLCVMTQQAGAWRLSAASVCFPSRWSLREKVGTTLGAIHDPVPGYHDTIGAVVDRSLDRLEVARPLWRLNWSILDDPALFQPVGKSGSRPGSRSIDELTFRVERQTLRRLPRTGAVLFTIRTYRHRLEDVTRDRARARDLAATLRTCPADLADYKGWTHLLPSLIDTLETDTDARPGRDSLQW